MGTSGAYGGTPGWNEVRDDTTEWLESGGGAGPPQDGSVPSPELARLIRGLVGRIGGAGGGGAGSGGGGGGGSGGGGQSTGRTSSIGGRAVSAAHGARTGAAAQLAELGLDLAELAGLSRYEVAQRIVDAALGPRGDVLDSELRSTNAAVVLWALAEEVAPTPAEITNRWVVEYVWERWITESGPLLQARAAEGIDRIRAEQEMRAALEASVSSRPLPDDRPLTSADFASAIESGLASLRRISGSGS